MVFSLILVVQKSTQTRIKIIGRLPNTEEWVPIDEDEAAQEELPGVVRTRSAVQRRFRRRRLAFTSRRPIGVAD